MRLRLGHSRWNSELRPGDKFSRASNWIRLRIRLGFDPTPYDYDVGPYAFVYDGSCYSLQMVGSVCLYGRGINDSGQIVGDNDGGAFIYDGAVHFIGTLGGEWSTATGINNRAQVTGAARRRDQRAVPCFFI